MFTRLALDRGTVLLRTFRRKGLEESPMEIRLIQIESPMTDHEIAPRLERWILDLIIKNHSLVWLTKSYDFSNDELVFCTSVVDLELFVVALIRYLNSEVRDPIWVKRLEFDVKSLIELRLTESRDVYMRVKAAKQL